MDFNFKLCLFGKFLFITVLFSNQTYSNTVCATAEIEILQTASIERQAFEARMHIQNTLTP